MRLNAYAMCCDEENIWFIPAGYSYLFKYSQVSKKIEMVCQLSENKECLLPYIEILRVKDFVICVPGDEKNIVIFNVKTRTLSELDLDTIFKEEEVNTVTDIFYFNLTVVYQTYIVFFGASAECVLFYNIENGEYIVDKDLYRVFSAYRVGTAALFRKDTAIIGSKIYIASYVTNQIIEYDLKSRKYELINYFREEKKGSCGICFDGEFFWILSNDGKLLQCDKGINVIEEIEYGETGVRIFCSKDNVFILSSDSNDIYIYSKSNKKFNIKKGLREMGKGRGIVRFPVVKKYKNIYFVCNTNLKKILCYDEEMNLLEEIDTTYSRILPKNTYIENVDITLEEMLKDITIYKKATIDSNIGMLVYASIN